MHSITSPLNPMSCLAAVSLAGTLLIFNMETASAQGVVKEDFRINEENSVSTLGEQMFPDVAASTTDGGFTAVWRDDPAPGGGGGLSGSRIYAQLFDRGGIPQGASIKLNDDDESVNWIPKGLPRVARHFPANAIGDPTGTSVVVWQDYREDSLGDIYGQIYNHTTGSFIGSNFRLNDVTVDAQGDAAVAMSPSGNGNFVVVYADKRSGDNDIYLRRFDRDGTPLGASVLVNDDGGTTTQSSPSVAVDANGDIVVVWRDFRDVISGLSEVWAQRFGSGGQPLGANFQVDQDVSGAVTPRVAVGGDGFVIAYTGGSGATRDILLKRYTADGTQAGGQVTVNPVPGLLSFPAVTLLTNPSVKPDVIVTWFAGQIGQIGSDVVMQCVDGSGNLIGSSTLVNTTTSSAQGRIGIATLGFGNITPPPSRSLIVWQDDRLGDSDIWGQVVLQRCDPDGPNFLVNGRNVSPTNQQYAAIATTFDGRSVVVWEDDRSVSSGLDIFGRRLDPNGNPLGADFKINDDPVGDLGSVLQEKPDVATDEAGFFVAVWTDYRDDNSGDIFLQHFNSSGVPQGANVLVNAVDAVGIQRNAAIDMSPGGAFIVVWEDTRNTAQGQIFAQRFDPDGTPEGDNFRVDSNDPVSGQPTEPRNPAVAMHADGAFTVAWDDARGGDDRDIWGQRFDADGSTIEDLFRANARPNAGADNIQMLPALDIAPGGHVMIAWLDYVQSSDGDIFATRYNSRSGIRVDELPLQVNDVANGANPFPSEFPFGPSVAALAGGLVNVGDNSFVVVWTDYRNGMQDPDIYAQRYTAPTASTNGEVDGNFRVDAAPTDTWQTFPDVARDASFEGKLFFSWTDDRELNAEGQSIWGKILRWDDSGVGPGGYWTIMARENASLVLRSIGSGTGDVGAAASQVTWSTNDPHSEASRAELLQLIQDNATEGPGNALVPAVTWGTIDDPFDPGLAGKILADVISAFGDQEPFHLIIGERLWVATTPPDTSELTLEAFVTAMLDTGEPLVPGRVVTASLTWGTVDGAGTGLRDNRMSELLELSRQNPNFPPPDSEVKNLLIFSPEPGLTPRIGLAAAYESSANGQVFTGQNQALLIYIALISMLKEESLIGPSEDVFFDVFLDVDPPDTVVGPAGEEIIAHVLELVRDRPAVDEQSEGVGFSLTTGNVGTGGRQIDLAFPIFEDADYFLEITDSLSPWTWQQLPGAPHNQGQVTDELAPSSRFYRLRAIRLHGFNNDSK